jgi:hypothetical protein
MIQNDFSKISFMTAAPGHPKSKFHAPRAEYLAAPKQAEGFGYSAGSELTSPARHGQAYEIGQFVNPAAGRGTKRRLGDRVVGR